MSINSTCLSGQDTSYAMTDAILLYREANRYGSGFGNVVYASVHSVAGDINGQPVIQPGVSVSKSALMEMFKTLTPEELERPALIEDRILAKGKNYMAWYCKPQKRDIWFKCNEIGEGEVHGTADHPGLVFMVMGGQWLVFAVKSKSRPTANTPLYVAPYLNVWAGGGICTGNIDLPKGQARFAPACWEESFYRTFFTHTNIHEQRGMTTYKGGPYALWRDLLKGKPFPNDSLVPMKKTLGQVFDALVGRMESGRD